MIHAIESDVALAEEVKCLAESSLLRLRKAYAKRPHRFVTVLGVRTPMLLVKPVGFKSAAWADLQTGSLYDRTSLRCLSGDIRLKWCEEVAA